MCTHILHMHANNIDSNCRPTVGLLKRFKEKNLASKSSNCLFNYQAHIYTHTNTRTYPYTNTLSRMHIHVHTHIHTHIHAIHARAHTDLYAQGLAQYLHNTYICIHMYARILTTCMLTVMQYAGI